MKISLLVILLLTTFEAWASCDYSKKPKISVKEEYDRSDFVFVATIKNQHVETYNTHPTTFEEVYFNIEVYEVIKGRVSIAEFKSEIFLTGNAKNKNFELINGEKYLLFVGYNPDGYLIRECGNSKKLENAKNILEEVKLLAKK